MAKLHRFLYLLLILWSGSNLYSQTYINITIPSQMILKGQPFEARIEAYGMPVKAVLQVKLNGHEIAVKDSVAEISIVDTIIGEYEAVIDARVHLQNKTIFREKRKLYYTIFPLVYALELGPSNVLYRGIENYLNLAVAGIPPQNIMLSITNGATIKKTAAGFSLQTYSRDSVVALLVAAKMANGGTVMLTRKMYRVVDRPAVVCSFDRKMPDIGAGDTAIRVIANIPGSQQQIRAPRVLAFSCRIWMGGTWSTYQFTGNLVKGELLQKIRNMKQGDLIFVEGIRIQWQGSNDAMFTDPFAVSGGQ